MHLNKHRPYGHVHGLVGVAFSQDGHFFDGSGRVVADPEGTTEEATKAEPSFDQVTEGVPVSAPPPEPEIAPTSSFPKDDMRLKKNKAIKFQWENFYPDEQFPGVAEAKRQLGITE